MKHDFLAVHDLSATELLDLFAQAEELKQAFHAGELPQLLRGQSVALWFNDGGFRNRVAFDLGIQALGGTVVHLPGQLGEREAVKDVGAYLGNWFDAVVVRAPHYGVVRELAESSPIPVINGRTAHNHPCEILGDLAFVQARRGGTLSDLTVVFVGEATNLCHSWFEAAVRLPIRVIQVCPPGFAADKRLLAELRAGAAGVLEVAHELGPALADADVIYTDCWPSGRTPGDRQTIAAAFEPYRIDVAALDLAPPAAVFLPCPPVTRGEEVADAALRSPRCQVYAAKEYLLHAQNALLVKLLT